MAQRSEPELIPVMTPNPSRAPRRPGAARPVPTRLRRSARRALYASSLRAAHPEGRHSRSLGALPPPSLLRARQGHSAGRTAEKRW